MVCVVLLKNAEKVLDKNNLLKCVQIDQSSFTVNKNVGDFINLLYKIC